MLGCEVMTTRPSRGWLSQAGAAASVLFLLLLVSGGLAGRAAASTNVLIQPASDWVQLADWNAAVSRGTNDEEGTYYLLYERQVHAGRRETFERTVVAMQSGLMRLPLRGLERWSHAMAGGVIAVSGLVIVVLGL